MMKKAAAAVCVLLLAACVGCAVAQQDEPAENKEELIAKLKEAYARKLAQEAAGEKAQDEPLSDADVAEILRGAKASDGAAAAAAAAEDDDPYAPHLRAAPLFPDNGSRQFQAGKVAEMLAGVTNVGAHYVLVTRLFVALVHPGDARFFVQNFTQRTLEVPVAPGEEASLQYMFMPDPQLEERFFRMLALAEVRDELSRNYSYVLFNETVFVSAAPWSVDWRSTAKSVAVGAGLVGALYVAYKQLAAPSSSSSSAKPAKKKPAAAKKPKQQQQQQTTAGEDFTESWLAGTSAAKKRTAKKSPSPPAAK